MKPRTRKPKRYRFLTRRQKLQCRKEGNAEIANLKRKYFSLVIGYYAVLWLALYFSNFQETCVVTLVSFRVSKISKFKLVLDLFNSLLDKVSEKVREIDSIFFYCFYRSTGKFHFYIRLCVRFLKTVLYRFKIIIVVLFLNCKKMFHRKV